MNPLFNRSIMFGFIAHSKWQTPALSPGIRLTPPMALCYDSKPPTAPDEERPSDIGSQPIATVMKWMAAESPRPPRDRCKAKGIFQASELPKNPWEWHSISSLKALRHFQPGVCDFKILAVLHSLAFCIKCDLIWWTHPIQSSLDQKYWEHWEHLPPGGSTFSWPQLWSCCRKSQWGNRGKCWVKIPLNKLPFLWLSHDNPPMSRCLNISKHHWRWKAGFNGRGDLYQLERSAHVTLLQRLGRIPKLRDGPLQQISVAELSQNGSKFRRVHDDFFAEFCCEMMWLWPEVEYKYTQCHHVATVYQFALFR